VILISVPRDLYYKGRKINAVYQLYGPAELAQEVAQITGLPIRKYVVIDMYAFIDAINIIGGIDLRLSAPLVDPTYRVRNNGEWTTLSYAPGIHHLDGIEALRIARSRHTTSDFARAYRQQDILAAIRDKIEKTDPLDVSKLYNLVGVFLRYVDTNFSPAEIVDTFLSYKDLPISGHYVIDTANVLYQTYSNIYYLGDNGKQVSASFDKGAWIVLPQGDDWNVIRRYVAGIIGGDTP
jgi:LCP family protein required for cell wall assembly